MTTEHHTLAQRIIAAVRGERLPNADLTAIHKRAAEYRLVGWQAALDRATEEWLSERLKEVQSEERESCAQLARRMNDVYNIGFCIASDIRERGKEVKGG